MALAEQRGTITRATVPDNVDLSAVALDDDGRFWAASLGRLWTLGASTGKFDCAWKEARWNVPVTHALIAR